MATALYHVGRFAFSRRWLVIFVWIALLGGVALGAQQLSGTTSEAFTIPGTESQQALDLLEERTGTSVDNGTARVVFRADGAIADTPAARHAVESAVTEMSRLPHVTSASDPFETGAVSADGSTAIATVTYDVQAAELTETDQDRAVRGRRPGHRPRVSPSTTAETRRRRRSARARPRRSASPSPPSCW